jgi:peptide/nickel transport system ATP-binding protein
MENNKKDKLIDEGKTEAAATINDKALEAGSDEPILDIRDLYVEYTSGKDVVSAVNGLNIKMKKGEALGLVGETGAGKTTTALSIMNLLPKPPARIPNGKIYFEGKNVFDMSKNELQQMHGARISMIFQDPMTSLNPVKTVGSQIEEVIKLHEKINSAQATVKAEDMLEMVGIPRERFAEYPHQFSGGMKQRVVIAIAMACNPVLLIADEPTTALDVTIQAQVLNMIKDIIENLQTTLILITHDLGIVAEICDNVAIMYAGEIVYGNLEQIYNHTLHPYTVGLFGSIPNFAKKVRRLKPINGLIPDPTRLPKGCNFSLRCLECTDHCKAEKPPLMEIEEGHFVKCFKFIEDREE